MDVAAIIPRWVNLRVIIILKWIQDINKGKCYLLEEALEDPSGKSIDKEANKQTNVFGKGCDVYNECCVNGCNPNELGIEEC